jgi:hypothetical protein
MANWATIWFILFVFAYMAFFIVLYKAYLSKLIKRLKYKNMYLHYHIIDTGEQGDYVFNSEKVNRPDGNERAYNRERVNNGTLFYESGNAEPLNVKLADQESGLYKYYCDTKNFDTVSRNTILETLMLLNAKQMLIMLLIVTMVLIIIVGGANIFLMHDQTGKILTAIQTLNPTEIQEIKP